MKLTDRTYLLTQQYNDSSKLNTRSSIHELYGTNPYPWHPWVFDQLHLTPGARILEIGCGYGMLWTRNLARIPAGCSLTLSDFSFGMLATATRNLAGHGISFNFACLDAQSIPFPTGTFDLVIANHMLYHVPDRPRALAEISRVLRPGGQFFAATNGVEHLHEIYAWVHQAIGLTDPPQYSNKFVGAFKLENGSDQIAPCFSQVELLHRPGGLRVTGVQPVIDYIHTLWSDDATRLDDAGYARLEALLTTQLQQEGVLSITTSTGLFHAIK